MDHPQFIRCMACREPTAHELRKLLMQVVGYACTAETINTAEWLDGMADLGNKVARTLGFEGGFYERHTGRPAITWNRGQE